mmetsp:Transcript_517/g.564  ORF Transcript_517/g.564 Transcript_517/m.564 type:complete len:101 (-) Transcript_517:30-332(-)
MEDKAIDKYEQETDESNEVIESFLCPITQQIMKDPVMTKYGHLYERTAIEAWIDKNNACPMTSKPLTREDIFPAYAVKNAIQEYIKKRGQEKKNEEENRI